MAEGESADAIDAAIQSAESLLGSLLVRTAAPTSPLTQQPLSENALEQREVPMVNDVETSLFPGQHAPPSPAHSLRYLSSSSSYPDTPTASSQTDFGGTPSHTSLLSLHGSGLAGGSPGPLTAGAHAVVGPLVVEEVQSLHELSLRKSIGAITPPPDYDTVYRILTERERDLELAARIGRSLLQRNELLEAELGSQLDHRQQLEQQLAQLRHALGQKEGLLRLYAQDANEPTNEGEGEGRRGEWIKDLTEECHELRENNSKLTIEADRLQQATVEVEQKKNHLVARCLEQFGEARERLAQLREKEELTSSTNQQLQAKLEELEAAYKDEMLSRQQLEGETESLRDQLLEAQDTSAQLTSQVTELQDKWEECSVLLKEAQDEVQALRETSLQSSSHTQDGEQPPAATDHESIVQEIEEALRKELIAASTLAERPASPKQYALQRTQAVMATVRAATEAMARRQERLAGQTKAIHTQQLKLPTISTPMHPFNPIATSSPEGQSAGFSVGVGTGGPNSSQLAPHPLSPAVSEAASLPDEALWLRHQHYVAPEKLQIVKPLEGSVTLLKWKLMASPQLGGATSFFSNASRPGVHVKGWKAAGIVDKNRQTQAGDADTLGLPPEMRLKSLSTGDLSYLAAAPPSSSSPSAHPHTPTSSHHHRRGPRRPLGTRREIHSRQSNLTSLTSAAAQGAESHDQEARSRDRSVREERRGSVEGEGKRGGDEKEEGHTSLLQHVGKFLGWGFGGARKSDEIPRRVEEDLAEVDSPGGTDMGLAGIL